MNVCKKVRYTTRRSFFYLSDFRAELLPCFEEGLALPPVYQCAQPLQPRRQLSRAGQAPRAVCATELENGEKGMGMRL